MARVMIDVYGAKKYLNDIGELHREDGPAVIWPNGRLEWFTKSRYVSRMEINGVYTKYGCALEYFILSPNGNIEIFIIDIVSLRKKPIWPELK